MSLNTLIVEDDLVSGQILEGIVKQLGHETVDIVPSIDLALLSVKNQTPDLIFMDIGLSGQINGIYGAELLSGYYKLPVIFVSAHADAKTISYAKKYGVGYIIKPFTAANIKAAIEPLAAKQTGQNTTKKTKNANKIKVRLDNQLFFIDPVDIICVESYAHSMTVYTKENKYTLRSSLKGLLEMDTGHQFLRVHKSYLINVNQVESLTHENYVYRIKLKNLDFWVPVSKKNVHLVKMLSNRGK